MKNTLKTSLIVILLLSATPQEAHSEVKPTALPKEITRIYQADQNCIDLRTGKLPHPIEKHDIGKDHTMYIIPCGSGAYNVFSKVYLVSSGELEQLFFADFHQSYGWSGTDILVNYGYDPKTKILSSFNKSAGHGWCGSAGRWRWEEYQFVMIEFQAWDDCLADRAPEDWPVIYKKE